MCIINNEQRDSNEQLNSNEQRDSNEQLNNDKIPANTIWYRMNKKNKKNVHTCSQCTYSTTGPKIILLNHIYSKHTEEQYRPFQCEYTNCNRGFAQKGSLKKHLEKKHNEKPHEKENKTIIEYHISIDGIKKPNNSKTKNRYEFYKQHQIITEKMLKENAFLSPSYILYDARVGYIKAKGYTLRELANSFD